MRPFTYFCTVEKIFQHIEKLLAQHDYVVVPNLGGFLQQNQSAKLLPDRITPPLATISFNPLMYHADGLLAIEIAKSEGLSYRMSVELLDIEVDKIKTALSKSGDIKFGNLGKLQQNISGNLVFTPFEKVDFLPQNFGLYDLHITTKSFQLTPERRKVTLTLPSTRMYKYAAAGMLILGLLCVSPRVNDMRQTETANLASLAFVNTAETAIDQKNAETTAIVTLDTVSNKLINSELENFHVIVASLQSKKTADNFCKLLKDENFSQAHVLAPIKTYRVAIQSFSDREEAIQCMENLRKTDKRFETAWVFCN